jgi:hypothetical protein
VRIGGDDGGARLVEGLEVGDGAAEGFEGLVRFQVADVLAEEDLLAYAEGNGVLQVRADGQDRIANSQWPIANCIAKGQWPIANGSWELDWERGIAAGAAENEFAAHHYAGD